jgi:hypothetical protein
VVEEMRAEEDPLALNIFVSRRNYKRTHVTKNGKRRDTTALLSCQSVCEMGFRRTLGECDRLMGATPKR